MCHLKTPIADTAVLSELIDFYFLASGSLTGESEELLIIQDHFMDE